MTQRHVVLRTEIGSRIIIVDAATRETKEQRAAGNPDELIAAWLNEVQAHGYELISLNVSSPSFMETTDTYTMARGLRELRYSYAVTAWAGKSIEAIEQAAQEVRRKDMEQIQQRQEQDPAATPAMEAVGQTYTEDQVRELLRQRDQALQSKFPRDPSAFEPPQVVVSHSKGTAGLGNTGPQ